MGYYPSIILHIGPPVSSLLVQCPRPVSITWYSHVIPGRLTNTPSLPAPRSPPRAPRSPSRASSSEYFSLECWHALLSTHSRTLGDKLFICFLLSSVLLSSPLAPLIGSRYYPSSKYRELALLKFHFSYECFVFL